MSISEYFPDDKALEVLKHLYDQISQSKIKAEVDRYGLDAFIETSARYAGIGGFAANAGGAATLVIGIPAEILNNAAQQIRVALAVIYAKTGNCSVTFPQCLKLLAVSVGVECGASIGKAVCIQIVSAMLVRIAATTSVTAVVRWVPLVAGVVCGGVNYGFIKSHGATLKRLDLRGPEPTPLLT